MYGECVSLVGDKDRFSYVRLGWIVGPESFLYVLGSILIDSLLILQLFSSLALYRCVVFAVLVCLGYAWFLSLL
jgi:hypothetical protein